MAKTAMMCHDCFCVIKTPNKRMKHQLRCIKRPIYCQYCKETFPYDQYDSDHGNLCCRRVMKCNFCYVDFLSKNLAQHLCKCEELNKRLLEKHLLVCDTSTDSELRFLLYDLLRRPKMKDNIRNFLSKPGNIARKIKIYYCFSNYPIFEDSEKKLSYDYFAQSLLREIPQELLSEVRFILGDAFTKTMLLAFCRIQNIKYNMTFDRISDDWLLLTIIDLDYCHYQFVSDKPKAKQYFESIHEVLNETGMNIYVCKMIKDYYFEDEY